jgi:hypothetical protein
MPDGWRPARRRPQPASTLRRFSARRLLMRSCSTASAGSTRPATRHRHNEEHGHQGRALDAASCAPAALAALKYVGRSPRVTVLSLTFQAFGRLQASRPSVRWRSSRRPPRPRAASLPVTIDDTRRRVAGSQGRSQRSGWEGRMEGASRGYSPFVPTSPLPGASTSPPPFRNGRRRHLHAAGRDTGGVAGDLFFAPRLPILDTAWP